MSVEYHCPSSHSASRSHRRKWRQEAVNALHLMRLPMDCIVVALHLPMHSICPIALLLYCLCVAHVLLHLMRVQMRCICPGLHPPPHMTTRVPMCCICQDTVLCGA